METIQIDSGARGTRPKSQGGREVALNALNAGLNGRGGRSEGKGPTRGGLSRDKLALVHVAKRDLQLEEDIYRATLRDAAGVDSARLLSEEGFRAVMRRMEQLGFKQQPAARTHDLGERIGMATSAQLVYVRALFYRWLGREDEAALVKFVAGRYGVSALRFLDVVRASKAIEGLKKMVKRKECAELVGAAEQRQQARRAAESFSTCTEETTK